LKTRLINLTHDREDIKFLYFTDTHYNATSPRNRKDNLLETSLEKTKEILDLIKGENADFVVHGGDFFQKADVTDLVAGRVAQLIKTIQVPFFVVPGNHDLFGNNIESIYRTKLGFFAKAGLVELLIHPSQESVIIRNSNLSVQLTGTASHYGIDYENMENDYILTYKNADFAVHVVHGMLVPKPFIPGVPSVLIDDILDTRADITLAGHYHIGFDPVQKNGKTFINCGSVVRRTNDLKEMSRTPQVLLVTLKKSGDIRYSFIQLKRARPGDEVLDRSEILRKQHHAAVKQNFVAQIRKTQNIQSLNIGTIVRELAQNKSLPQGIVKEALDRISKIQELMGENDSLKPGNGLNKYLHRVIMENFQSHERTVIDFEKGINAIVGQSDKGKTAIIRAIKWVLYNEPRGSDFVRHGTDECCVTLEMSNGWKVTRARRKSKNYYIVEDPSGNGYRFENIGTGVPAEVIEATGIAKIIIDTDKELALNLNEQLDPPFLLAETGSVKAKAIGSIVKTHLLDASERDVQKEILQLTTETKELEKQLEEKEAEISKYGDMAKLENVMGRLEELIKKLKEKNTAYEKLIYINRKILAIKKEMESTKETLSQLAMLPHIEITYLQLKDMFRTQQNMQSYRSKIKAVEQSIRENEDILTKLKSLDELETKVQQLSAVHQTEQVLEQKFRALLMAEGEMDRQKTVLEKLQTVKSLEDKTERLSSLFKTATVLDGCLKKKKDNDEAVSAGRDYLKKVNANLEYMANEYAVSLKKLGKCPTCLHDISDEEVQRIAKELKGEVL
jgi:exonuclease SbcC